MGTEIYARGTAGDALMILLKIINTDITKVNHHSVHHRAFPLIEEIYSLKPGLKVEFLDELSPKHRTIAWIERSTPETIYVKGAMEDYETYTPHPQLVLPCIDQYNLPTEYNVVQLSAGDLWRSRHLEHYDLDTVDQSLPVVLLGTDERSLEIFERADIIDLRNKCSLLTSFAVLANAKTFYGPQGLLAFFALSQRVKASIFLKSDDDIDAVWARIHNVTEWHDDVTYCQYLAIEEEIPMIKESQWRSCRVPDKHFSQILEKHIKPTTPRVFIECGANDGINGSIGYYFENELGWQTINIEANPFSWRDLLHNRPHSINLNVGLSDSDAILELTMPMDGPNGHAPGRASFMKTMDFWRAEGREAIKCEVLCTTYKQAMLEQNIPGVGIFVLDVEGLEEKVLRGMQGVKPSHLPHILCIENWAADWTATTALVEKLGPYEPREQYKNNLIYVIKEQDDSK